MKDIIFLAMLGILFGTLGLFVTWCEKQTSSNTKL